MNSYSYANDNPITRSDPDGLSAQTALQGVLSQLASTLQAILYQISQPQFVQQYRAAQTGVSIAQSVAQNPVGALNNAYSAGRNYVSSTYNAFKTIGRSDSGDYLLGQRLVDVGLLAIPGFGEEADAVGMAAKLQIKAGSAGGPTAGKVFSQAVKDAAKAENPTATCVFCHMEGSGTTVDHAIPRVNGGNATLDNAQLACPHCNSSKGANQFPLTPPSGYVGAWPPSWWNTGP